MPAEPSARGSRRSLRIGAYAVEEPITFGSLGSAYRATDESSGVTVALKVVPAELTGNPGARERFQREAKRAARVRATSVVRVIDFGEASGTWYLALEFVQGVTLTDHIQRHGALDGESARDVLVQIARALCLLQREGIVPRDLSPDNFRVVRGPDSKKRIGVKLLDLGLLRPADDNSPADIRAALKALGSTAWFVLTGLSGGRPDLAALAGDVSDELRGVLARLLAGRSEERYPTPAAVLEALGAEEPAEADEPVEEEQPVVTPHNALAALSTAEDEVYDEPPAEPAPSPKRLMRRRGEEQEEPEPPAPARRRDAEDKADAEPRPARPAPSKGGSRKALVWGAIAFGAVLLIGAGIIVAMSLSDDKPKGEVVITRKSGSPTEPVKIAAVDTSKQVAEAKSPSTAKANPSGEKPAPQQPPPVPRLYEFKQAPVWAKVRTEYVGPWSSQPQPPNDTTVYRVARVAPAAVPSGPFFDSIAAACAAVPEGKWGIVEIQDDGPIFEAPIHVSGRNIVITAARGYAPLIIWDPTQVRAELKPGKPSAAALKDDVHAFLTLENGTLLLNNLHFAVDWPERAQGTGCLVRVAGGNLVAWGSTFSIAGKPRGPFTVIRFEGGPGKRCRLTQCFARGAPLTALELPTPGADVMIDGSLFVGGEPPLLVVAAGDDEEDATTLRVLRSTLMAREVLLQVRSTSDAIAPTLHWMGWDALLWRAGEGAGGTLVELPKECNGKGITWQAINSLYAGWQTLLAGRDTIAGSDQEQWQGYWHRSEGDVSLSQLWVKSMPRDPSQMLHWSYNTASTPVGFAATNGNGLLGCDLAQLPWVRSRWLDLSTQRTLPADCPVMSSDANKPIAQAEDQLYHGERIDLDRVPDLGAYLRQVQSKTKLAPEVVLQLHGTGRRKMTPVRFEKTDLFVYVEPPVQGTEPLVIEPDVTVAPNANGLFEVVGGTLWMVGADIRCPDFKSALLPHALVWVQNGSLYLSGTRLQGPVKEAPPDYWALVRVEGSGYGEHGRVYVASFNECMLISSKIVLHLAGAGLRTGLRQSLIVSTGQAVNFQTGLPQKPVPGAPTPADSPAERHGLFGEALLNMELTADHCTFAAKSTVFFADDVPVRTDSPPYLWPVIASPIVIQAKDCAFLNPFAEKDGKSAPASLLAYSRVALQRGLLCWQGEGNLYDKRLQAYVATLGKDGTPAPPDKPQPYAVWEHVWGPADVKPVLDVALKGTIDLDKLPLEHLALPAHGLPKEKPGADVTKLLAQRKPR
jgi:serine/threonine-protein kinase